MLFFRQITNAIFSATNENNLQLASLKWNFSLGTRLGIDDKVEKRSRARSQHRIARRLAALLEQLIPSTSKLVAAYGIRVSEIIQKPDVNF